MAPAMMRAASCLLMLLLAAFVAAGCGGADESVAANGAKILHVASGPDPSGTQAKVLAECNRKANGAWQLKQVTLPPGVDQQREQIIRRLAGKDSTLDILGMDVIWTAEFSEAGWVVDLTERVTPKEAEIVPAALETAKYKDKYWALPWATNVALLYYRTDLVDKAPETWEEMVEVAKKVQAENPGMAGFVFQANQYEGLTVNSLEFLHAAEANVIDEAGKKATLNDGDGAVRALTFMRELFESGVTPKSVSTFQEEESRQYFQKGNAVFMRNWPYAYTLGNLGDSKIKGKFAAAPLPKFEGATSAGVLGGFNWGISTFSKHPEEAWAAIDCMASVSGEKQMLIGKGNLPALLSIYDDPEAKKAVPHIAVIREGLKNAHPRPVSPYYNDVTVALQRNIHKVVTGAMSAEDAVESANDSVQLAIVGNGEI